MPATNPPSSTSPVSQPETSQEPWKFLGKGSFNKAYRRGNEVLKIQIPYGDVSDVFDAPERSVRLWGEINPTMREQACIIQIPEKIREEIREETRKNSPKNISEEALEMRVPKVGWICPYVEGEQATDDEISSKTIDIFNSTGRIVLDPLANNNFLRTRDGQVVCIDVGLAYQVEQDSLSPRARGRSNSVTSPELKKYSVDKQMESLNRCKSIFPKTVAVLKALFFIHEERPDITDVSFLKKGENLELYAEAYDIGEDLKKNARDELAKQQAIGFENMQKNCVDQLQRYINSRGILYKGSFAPSLMTMIFRNTALAERKATEAQRLIDKINSATTISEIQEALSGAGLPSSPREKGWLTRGCVTSGMEDALKRCQQIISKAPGNLAAIGPSM